MTDKIERQSFSSGSNEHAQQKYMLEKKIEEGSFPYLHCIISKDSDENKKLINLLVKKFGTNKFQTIFGSILGTDTRNKKPMEAICILYADKVTVREIAKIGNFFSRREEVEIMSFIHYKCLPMFQDKQQKEGISETFH